MPLDKHQTEGPDGISRASTHREDSLTETQIPRRAFIIAIATAVATTTCDKINRLLGGNEQPINDPLLHPLQKKNRRLIQINPNFLTKIK